MLRYFNFFHISCDRSIMSAKKHVFTPIEKDVLKDILKKYAQIIENKCTDGVSLHKKKEAWNQLALEYNASPHVTAQVTSQQLKRLWMNLKQRQREAMTKECQHRLATGGGPPVPSPTSIHSFQRQKNIILGNNYEDRKRRADECHALEMILLKEKIREAKAKADLAELLLEQQRQQLITSEEGGQTVDA